MSKLAKVRIRLNSTVMLMMLRIIGNVMWINRCQAEAPSMDAASYSCSGTDFSAAMYMIRKNGAPYQTLTRITENRAHQVAPSHGIGDRPIRSSSQFSAE